MRTHRPFTAFLVVATFLYVAFAVPSNYDINSDYELCTTQACRDEASRVLHYIDRTVDPCDNFYKFACGGWMKENPANVSYPLVSTLLALQERTLREIKEIVEGTPRSDETLSLTKARKLYNMCMDTDTLRKIGINDLSNLVQKLGGWPIITTSLWKLKGYQIWQEVSDKLQDNMFSNGLYEIAVSRDDKKSDTNVITIEEPDFYVPRDILISFEKNFTEKMSYKSYIEKVATMIVRDRGADVPPLEISRDALDIVNFEIELAKLALSLEDSRDIDKTYNPLTIAELQQAYDAQHPSERSKISWLYSIRRLFAPEGIVINSSEKLIVQAYKYLTSLVPLLERTRGRTIINYMQWSLIRDLLPYTESTQMIAVQLTVQFKNEKPEFSRWKNCLQKDANLHKAISQEYAKRYVQIENRKNISNIVTDIANVIRKQIAASTWMDEPTKKVSLEKLKSMKWKILIPDWYSNEAIDEYYDDLNISLEYFESVINVFKFEFKKILGKLRKPVDKTEWLMEPTTVNAYYNVHNNEIVITNAITQNPVYDNNRPAVMNYGGMGVVIGHEINHGFDSFGDKFDKNGNAVEWWTSETIKKFEKIAQCFVDQYNDFLVPGLEEENIHVNGQLSLGENIADSAGLVSAYYAYKDRKERLNEPELRLQGLEEYNEDQIFFMGFTHVFCQSTTSEQIRRLQLDEHPMPETRIRGSYSNFPEFAKAYNCPVGKNMNPKRTPCVMWQ